MSHPDPRDDGDNRRQEDDLRRRDEEEAYAYDSARDCSIRTAAYADKRPVIKGLFGERAERLAWIFSTINRPRCFEGEPFANWKTGEPVEVSEEDIKDLMLIEVANLSDNGEKLSKFPTLERFYHER